MPQPNQITPAQLSRLIGTPEAPTLIDVRLPEDLARDPRLIPGSLLAPHDGFDPGARLSGHLPLPASPPPLPFQASPPPLPFQASPPPPPFQASPPPLPLPTRGRGRPDADPSAQPSPVQALLPPGGGGWEGGLAARKPGPRVVVICARGRKLSEGVAALLRTQGVTAQVLEGGVVAWAEAGLPMVPLAALPQGNLWVTRHRPKIDRIACPWLIRRFIDPSARFLFVAPSEVPRVAEAFAATPFDIEGTFWSHRGEGCTFDTMLAEWGLQTEALQRLALVVRAADTDRHDLAPQAAGLLALSVGLSRLYRDDLEQLAAGLPLYDALYRWARDGHDETHDWPSPGAAK